MRYTEESKILQKCFNQNTEQSDIPELHLRIQNLTFSASDYFSLPGVSKGIIEKELSGGLMTAGTAVNYKNPRLNEIFNAPDALIAENNIFKYILLTNPDKQVYDELILLFHGLNEKSWAKYLTWASVLHKKTGKAVILFPITFHMNRCPETWSNRRLMNEVSIERKSLFPGLTESSFANAAISTRLTFRPQRFFFSGFQTYYDLMKLLGDIRQGKLPFVKADAQIDIFSYSIGAFLSEILFFSGASGYLENAKLCMFCGGTTTDKFRPAVKTIMDSNAFERFNRFYAQDFEKEVERNPIMREFYKNPLPEALAFKSLLSTELLRDHRECKLRESAQRIYTISLKQDYVIPAESVESTLKGEKGDIPVKHETLDFPYRYTHESPFPLNDAFSMSVDQSFEEVFDKISCFLNSSR